jgi:hypothetical protein
VNQLGRYLALRADVASTLERFSPEVFEVDLDSLCAAMAPARAGGFARIRASLFSGDYKAARSELRGSWPTGQPNGRTRRRW